MSANVIVLIPAVLFAGFLYRKGIVTRLAEATGLQ